MKLDIKVMLLGVSLILLSIACNSQITLYYETVNTKIGIYSHFIGILVVIVGFFAYNDSEPK